MRSRKSSKGEQATLAWDPVGLMAGVDEAGRGPLAGPVVAAAVILDDAKRIRGLADSKVLTPLQREKLYDQIMDKALCCSVAQASVGEIDSLNIYHATMLAMSRAVDALGVEPGMVLVDGNALPKWRHPARAIVSGDALSRSIAAASIIAKVTRDRMMQEYDGQYPGYGWRQNKGYGTAEHRAALIELGPTPLHRRSFAPVRAALAATPLQDPLPGLPPPG